MLAPKSMKRFAPWLVFFAIGLAVGWYAGGERTRRQFIGASGFTEKEYASLTRQVPVAMASMKRQDETAAYAALSGLSMLDRNNIPGARKKLAYWVGSYYRVYHMNGDAELLAHIEKIATTNQEVAAEIKQKLNN
jgi:hypothetical protein